MIGRRVGSFLHLSVATEHRDIHLRQGYGGQASAPAWAPKPQAKAAAAVCRGGERRGEHRTDVWRAGDVERAAVLLHAAYSLDAGRPFAPNGRPEEWQRYVGALVWQSPCGVLDREITRVVRDGDCLVGLALVTFVPPSTAHLAQLAIHPDWKRQGLATALVRDVQALAAVADRHELTLLVASSNTPARRTYASLGFCESGAGSVIVRAR